MYLVRKKERTGQGRQRVEAGARAGPVQERRAKEGQGGGCSSATATEDIRWDVLVSLQEQ